MGRGAGEAAAQTPPHPLRSLPLLPLLGDKEEFHSPNPVHALHTSRTWEQGTMEKCMPGFS